MAGMERVNDDLLRMPTETESLIYSSSRALTSPNDLPPMVWTIEYCEHMQWRSPACHNEV